MFDCFSSVTGIKKGKDAGTGVVRSAGDTFQDVEEDEEEGEEGAGAGEGAGGEKKKRREEAVVLTPSTVGSAALQVLGKDRRDGVFSSLYMMRVDSSSVVRQIAIMVRSAPFFVGRKSFHSFFPGLEKPCQPHRQTSPRDFANIVAPSCPRTR